ncbi:MAG: hypothetical protein V3R84_04935 [Acidimicrobiia bacterium]
MNKKLVVAIVAFGVLTAGCEMRADFRLILDADESGQVLVSIGLDEEFQALVESSGEPIEDSFFGEDNPFGELPGAEQRTYEEDDFTFYEASVPFSDLNGLRLLGTDADNFLNDFDIEIDEDTAQVSGNIDLAELTGGDLADDQLAGIGADALANIFQFHIQIEMPGSVTSSNRDRVLDDGALEWDIPLTGDVQTLSIEAQSNLKSGGGTPAWLIVLILAALAVAIAFFVMRSRRGPPQVVAGETAVAVPASDAPMVTEVDPEPPATEA